MNRPLYAAFIILFISLAACTQDQTTTGKATDSDADSVDTRRTYRQIVDDINARVPSLAVVTGTYTAGDATSEYRAYYGDKGELLFIHEHLDMGPNGSSTNRYYFDGDMLLYTEEDKLSRGMSEDGARQTRMIVQWMVFDSTGAAIQAEKQVDGKPRAPESAEAKSIRKHADELRQAAAHFKGDMHMGAANPSNN